MLFVEVRYIKDTKNRTVATRVNGALRMVPENREDGKDG